MPIRLRARVEDMPELAEIGKRVKTRRQLLGLTRLDLARQAGFGDSHLLNIEKGLRVPGAGSLIRLHRALGVSTDYLLGLAEY